MSVKKLLSYLMFAFVLLGVTTVFSDARAEVVQLDSDDDVPPIKCPVARTLPVPLLQQAEPVWCWVTTTQMSLLYKKNESPLQCTLVEIAIGAKPGLCCYNPGLCQVPGVNMSSISTLLDDFDVSSTIEGPMSADEVYDAMKAKTPIIAQIKTSAFSSHVVVLRGMKYVRVGSGDDQECVPYVYVNDPMSYTPKWHKFEVLESANWIDSLIVE